MKALQVGTEIQLRFTLPDTATDGQGLTKPLEIDILRAGEKPAPGIASTPLVSLQGGELGRHASGGKVEFNDSLTQADFQHLTGATLTYEVRGVTHGFRGSRIEGSASNQVRVHVLDVPEPPSGLAVEATASALRLHWSDPSQTVTGKPLNRVDGYRVYRSASGASGPYQSIGETHDAAFSDASFEFGHPYAYRVRALLSEAGQTAESADSNSVEIIPRDVFPPSAPQDLTGLYTANGVELIWSPNTEADLAGYNIYRGAAGEKPVKLNADLLGSPLYRDASITSARRYTYHATAVDMSGNESAPSADIIVDVP